MCPFRKGLTDQNETDKLSKKIMNMKYDNKENLKTCLK